MMETKGTFEANEKLADALPEQRCDLVTDIMDILMCGKRTVYELMKRNEFRYIRLGRGAYRISKRSFDEWLDKQQNNQ